MANVESNTLLEKLREINKIREEIQKAVVEVGGEGFIDNDTPFSEYPKQIESMVITIDNVSSLLNYILTGKYDDTKKYTYKEIYQELLELQQIKDTVRQNLQYCGIYDNDMTFKEMADKIKDIRDKYEK